MKVKRMCMCENKQKTRGQEITAMVCIATTCLMTREDAGSGCHSATAREVNATFITIGTVSSQMMIPPDGRGGVLTGTSPELACVCSAIRCLFWERPEGGGGSGGSRPCNSYYCVAGLAPDTKRLIVIAFLVTMS